MIKGAPEIIIAKCSTFYFKGQKLPITNDFLASFQATYEQFGKLGERVLGFAEIKVLRSQFVSYSFQVDPIVKGEEYSLEAKNYPIKDLRWPYFNARFA